MALALGWALAAARGDGPQPRVRRAWAAALAAALAMAWGAQCADRCGVWRHEASLWSDTLRSSPGLGPVHANLARAWMESPGVPAPGRLDAAVARAEAALQMDPADHVARIVRAMAAVMHGRLAWAREDLTLGIRLSPREAGLWNALGFVCMQEGQGSTEAAEACFRRAIEVDPLFEKAYGNLAGVMARKGQWAEARACLEKAVDLAPNQGGLHLALAQVCLRLGLRADALARARMAVKLDPGNPQAKSTLAEAERPR